MLFKLKISYNKTRCCVTTTHWHKNT